MDVASTQAAVGRAGVDPRPRSRTGAVVGPLLRVVVLVSALLLLTQPVLAGRSLDGSGAALRLHMTVAVVFLGVAIVQDVVAIVWWRATEGAGWVPIVAVASHLLGLLQMELGHARTFALHLPVGIALVLLAAALVVGAWTRFGQRPG